MHKKFLKLVSLLLVMSLLLSSFVVSARPVDESEPETVITFDEPVEIEVEAGEPSVAMSAVMASDDLWVPNYGTYPTGAQTRGPALVVDGYSYPVATELPLGIAADGTFTPPNPHAMTNGNARWYRYGWNAGEQHTAAFDRAAFTNAAYFVVEYDIAPAGRLGMAIWVGEPWSRSFAEINALAASSRLILQGDGTKARFVFDLNSPGYVKGTGNSFNLMVTNETPNGSRLTRAYFATTRSMAGNSLFVNFLANDNREVWHYPTGYTDPNDAYIPEDKIVITKNSSVAERTFTVTEGSKLYLNVRSSSTNQETFIYLDNVLIPSDVCTQTTNHVVTLDYANLKENSVLTFGDAPMVNVNFHSGDTGSNVPTLRVALSGLIPKPADPTNTNADLRFGGWFETPALLPAELWDFDIDRVPGPGDMTLYASWNPLPVYDVKFILDEKEFAVQQVVEGQRATAPDPAPVHADDGWSFDGWYLGDATEPFDFDTLITEAITLTGKWVAADVEVQFERLAANGSEYVTETDMLTITLDKVVAGLTANDITVIGATKGALTGDGPVYTLAVSGITGQWQRINVKIEKDGFAFTPASRNVSANSPDAGKGIGSTINLSGNDWKIAPGVERLELVGGTTTIPLETATTYNLSVETRNNNMRGQTYSGGRAGKIPARVPDADAKNPNYDTSNWVPATVPGSVLGSLIDDKAYDYLMRLNNDEEIDVNFDINRARVQNDFRIPWWYSKDITLSADDAARFATIKFISLNYTAQVFVNGVEVKNTRPSTTHEELQNRSGTLVLGPSSGADAGVHQSNFHNQPSAAALGTPYNSGNGPGWPIDSIKKGPYTYNDNPSTPNTPAASTADRRGMLEPGGGWEYWNDGFQGAFRSYEIDVTGLLVPGKNNIKVKVMKGDRNNDFNYNLHDWHMSPVDMMMGITYDAILELTDVVRLNNPFVSFEVNKENTEAKANFFVDVNNFASSDVTGTIYARVYGPDDPDMKGAPIKSFQVDDVIVPADEYNYEVALPQQTFSGADLQLWWPYMSGAQPLYHVAYEFVPKAEIALPISGKTVQRFGIRQLTTQLDKYSMRPDGVMMQVFVNHKPVMIKGGGYTPTDIYMRQHILYGNAPTHHALVDLMKSMGFNAMRDEGKFFSDDLYDIMDEEGIFLIPGYMCCDRHEINGLQNYAMVERFILYEQTYSQIRRIRHRPSMLMWMNGSDYTKERTGATLGSYNVLPKMLEIQGRLRMYDHMLVQSSGSGPNTGGASTIIGSQGGLEMEHNYDTTVPAAYYSAVPDKTTAQYANGELRGIYAFISEGGVAGGSVPVVETLRRFIPEANLWPLNRGYRPDLGEEPVVVLAANNANTETTTYSQTPGNYLSWNYHSARGGSNFHKMDVMMGYTDNAFGGADTLEEAVMQFNLYQYEYSRAGFEAMSKYRYSTAKGMITWMMNGVRPTIMWNNFDYYMNPHGSTYGIAKANQPVHIMYDPYGKEISVANSTFNNYGNLTAEMTLYDIEANVISNTLRKVVNVVPDAIGESSGARMQRTVGFVPSVRSGKNWYNEAEYTSVTYTYPAVTGGNNSNGYVDEAGNLGINKIWNQADIDGALFAPTSDVYFMRLELKDGAGESIAYNTYAISRRESVSGASASWNKIVGAQSMDWTQLKTLPKVDLVWNTDASYIDPADNRYRIQEVTITNPTESIAHAVEVKSYDGPVSAPETLLSPAVYDDNMITLFPGQTRTITLRYQRAIRDSDVVIGVDCFNNVITHRPERIDNLYHAFSPIGQTQAGSTATTPNATTNLVRNRQFNMSLSDGSYSAQNNIAQPSSGGLGWANRGTTLLESNLLTNVAIAGGAGTSALQPLQARGGFRVDLGSEQTFDRILGRWGSPTTGGPVDWSPGLPDYVTVEISDQPNSGWVYVPVRSENRKPGNTEADNATYDNTHARAMLTNILLDGPVTARYIRITLNGLTPASSIFGQGDGTIGSPTSAARNAATNFHINGFDVYNSFNYVFVEELPEKLSIATGGRTITSTTPAYVYASAANLVSADRYLKKHAGTNLTLNITSGYPVYDVYLDGEKITNQLAGNTLTLTDEQIHGNSVLTFKVPVTQIRIDSLSIFTVARYEVYNFSYSLNDGAVSDNIRWQIADPKLGYVDDNGQVTIFDKIGNVRLTATEVETGHTHSITLRIAS